MTKASSTFRAGESVEINLLREADLSAALQLEEREEWNQTEDDWKRILRLNPNGCFAPFCFGELDWRGPNDHLRQGSGVVLA